MRCRACNARLKVSETGRTGVNSGEYLDLCTTCLSGCDDFAYTDSAVNLGDVELDQESDYDNEI
jgi:RNase P subunit RPR2